MLMVGALAGELLSLVLLVCKNNFLLVLLNRIKQKHINLIITDYAIILFLFFHLVIWVSFQNVRILSWIELRSFTFLNSLVKLYRIFVELILLMYLDKVSPFLFVRYSGQASCRLAFKEIRWDHRYLLKIVPIAIQLFHICPCWGRGKSDYAFEQVTLFRSNPRRMYLLFSWLPQRTGNLILPPLSFYCWSLNV